MTGRNDDARLLIPLTKGELVMVASQGLADIDSVVNTVADQFTHMLEALYVIRRVLEAVTDLSTVRLKHTLPTIAFTLLDQGNKSPILAYNPVFATPMIGTTDGSMGEVVKMCVFCLDDQGSYTAPKWLATALKLHDYRTRKVASPQGSVLKIQNWDLFNLAIYNVIDRFPDVLRRVSKALVHLNSAAGLGMYPAISQEMVDRYLAPTDGEGPIVIDDAVSDGLTDYLHSSETDRLRWKVWDNRDTEKSG